MLGWPSPTYPTLLKESSSIHITLDQSAMIAGFLMIGVSISTPFSSRSRFGYKFGILGGLCFILTGWIVMWRAKNIYYLLVSRLLVGIGFGYGQGQTKLYQEGTFEKDLIKNLKKVYYLYTVFGVILAFIIGPLVEFEEFSLICVCISGVVLAVTLVIKQKKRPSVKEEEKSEIFTFKSIFLDNGRRQKFLIQASVIFFQQFTGFPATIVYSQIIFTELNTPHPEAFAITYILIFFFSNSVGIFYFQRSNIKILLLVSSAAVLILITLLIVTLRLKLTTLSVILMYLYAFFHTVGLGTVPSRFLSEIFSSNFKDFMEKFSLIFFSILALIITKIFQLFYDRYSLSSAFCVFLLISLFSLLFVIIFIPSKVAKLNEIKTKEII